MESSVGKIITAFFLMFLFVGFTIFHLAGGLDQNPRLDQAVQTTTHTSELLQLQLSKEQIESSSLEGSSGGNFLGTVGYIQGSSEGRPVTYIYIRYRAENGDIIDRLIPRDQVRLRDDLASGEGARVEVETVKKRTATYSDIQQDPALCYESNPLRGSSKFSPKEKRVPLAAEKCGRHANDIPDEWVLEREAPTVVHVPKDAIIVTINPNMVPEGAKKG